MSKLRLFLENFIVYGVGGVISQIIPLIMIPIVTRLMPSSDYYGIYDLSNTVVNFGSAIALMGMYDAMYRMFFEREEQAYKKRICSTALCFTLLTSVVVFCIMLLMRNVIARYFFGDPQYAYVVYLSAMATLVGATNSIISAPTRMQNKRKVFLVTNTVSPILSYGIAVPMLLAGHYVIALPLAAVVSAVTMEVTFGIMNREWFSVRLFDKALLQQLLVIAVPLMPDFLIYWVFNSSDKMMITNMIGVGAAGIYSIGSKLGLCSQLIYTAFAGGWQYFAFSTMKDADQVVTTSRIFEYLGILSYVCTTFIFVLAEPIYEFLFVGEYVSGYIVSPYLFLAPLLQMLFQVACNQFLVIKKTWPNMLILSTGAVANIAINYCLIPVLGIEGAAIATLVGYAISDVICVIVLQHMQLLHVKMRFAIASGIMFVFILIWRLVIGGNIVGSCIMAVVASVAMVGFYLSDLRQLWKTVTVGNGN